MGKLMIKRYTCPFPIKCESCCHSENVTSGLSFPCDLDTETDVEVSLKPVAIDCEMVGVGPKMLNALGRVSIVDYDGMVLYDVMVRPEEEVTDFRTRWSGIRPSDMRRSIPFVCAQEQVERIIQNRIIVGHMIQNDLSVLRLKHPTWLIRDTAKAPYAKLTAGFPPHQVISLRALALRLFGIRIQTGEHCSTEDARATMAIYRLTEKAWEANLLRTSHPAHRPHTETDLLSSSVCEYESDSAASPHTKSLKRCSTGTANLFNNPDPESLSKRLCQEPRVQTGGLLKSASSSSLLDDNFWPEDCAHSPV